MWYTIRYVAKSRPFTRYDLFVLSSRRVSIVRIPDLTLPLLRREVRHLRSKGFHRHPEIPPQ